MNTGSERLINYLEQALRTELSVAPFELAQDSQTKWVVSRLEKRSGEIHLLDYGCGNLRLLNAIRKRDELHRVRYFATDKNAPEITQSTDSPYKFIGVHKIRTLSIETIDVVVLMNVVHELSLLDFADAIESARRLLKPDGELLLIDMAMLPEGEFRALPYYPWEISSLFLESFDSSYISKSGIPVVAMSVPKSGIPIYAQFIHRLCNLVLEKREDYCKLACVLPYKRDNPEIERILNRFSLNKDEVFDLGYLMLMSGFANFRIREHLDDQTKPSYEEISIAAEAVLRFFFKYCDTYESYPTFFTLLNELGALHSYRSLSHCVGYMSGGVPAFFFLLDEENLGESKLKPTEALDVFEDCYEYRHIAELGLGNLQVECHRHKEPGNRSVFLCEAANEWLHWT